MKIGVIGTFIKDQIILANRTEINSLGGIFYTISILGNLVTRHDEIYPVCYLGQDIYDDVINRLSGYPTIKWTGVKKVAQQNTSVKLIYKNAEQRDEYLHNRLPSMTLEHLQSIDGLDVWLLNFITGFEMSRITLRQFLKQKQGVVYMDFHSLSLGRDVQGHRFYRQLSDWENWIRDVDMLQMNDAEAATLIGHPQVTRNHLVAFGQEIISKGINIFHLTRGSKGSLLFFRQEENVVTREIPAYQVESVIDVTGCGDAFAAGFLVHYFKNKDVVAASYYANFVAGINCTISGSEELYRLRQILTNSNGYRRGI